jgi:hypothetical protein
MEEDSVGLTGMAWNGANQFWHDWNSLKGWKSVTARLERLGMEKIRKKIDNKLTLLHLVTNQVEYENLRTNIKLAKAAAARFL